MVEQETDASVPVTDRSDRALTPESGSPSSTAPIRIYYIGRKNATAERLKAIFARTDAVHEEAVRARSTQDPLSSPISEAKTQVAQNGTEPALRRSVESFALSNQKAALRLIRTHPPSLFLVEIDARSSSRTRFCEMLRYRLPTAAIIAVGAAPSKGNFAFDGFVATPPAADQVQALLVRLEEGLAGYVVQRGPIRLDVATRTVVTPNGQHHMTPKQCALLQYLMTRHNQVVKRNEIMQAIWETTYMDDTRTLDVHVRWLRECIEPDPSNPIYLITVRGIGYQLRLPG